MTLPKPNPGSSDHSEFTSMDSVPDELDPRKVLSGAKRIGDRKGAKRRHGWYSDAQKMKAACAFAVTGNSKRVSEMINVPEGTIRAWKTTEWWQELQSRIRQEHNEELDTKLTKLVDKAVDALNDRLESGEYVYNVKSGEVIRKPVGARDLSHITAQMLDKRQLLRGEPTSRTAKVSENEKLNRLAEEFKKFAQAKEIVSVAINIEEELAEDAIEEGQIQEDNSSEYSHGNEAWEAAETGNSDSYEHGGEDEEQEEETLTIDEMFSAN